MQCGGVGNLRVPGSEEGSRSPGFVILSVIVREGYPALHPKAATQDDAH